MPKHAVLCSKKFGRLAFLSIITVLRPFFCILSSLHLSDAFVNKHTIEQLFSPKGITELKRHNKVFSGNSFPIHDRNIVELALKHISELKCSLQLSFLSITLPNKLKEFVHSISSSSTVTGVSDVSFALEAKKIA